MCCLATVRVIKLAMLYLTDTRESTGDGAGMLNVNVLNVCRAMTSSNDVGR